MSTDDMDIQDRLERIRARVDNWERGERYRPSELPQDAVTACGPVARDDRVCVRDLTYVKHSLSPSSLSL